MNARFRSHEKLKDARSVSYVFENGKKFHHYPLFILFAPIISDQKSSSPDLSPHKLPPQRKIAFTVPKRKFPKAVDRNRIKRMMREAYRLQKNSIPIHNTDKQYPTLGIIVIYIGKVIPEYSDIFKAMNRFIDQLAKVK